MQLSRRSSHGRSSTEAGDGSTSVRRRQSRVCDVADSRWSYELAARHEDRELDAEQTESVFAEQVRPWLAGRRQKLAAQKGTRLVDDKWYRRAKRQNRQYIASVRRKHQEREELIVHRREAKNVFVRDVRKTQRMWMTQLGSGLSSRNLPDINILTPATMKDMLLEVTAAMRGEATDSTGGRRMKIIAAAREAEIDINSLHWRTIMKFYRLPTVAELSDDLGHPDTLFAEGGLLTDCPLHITFKNGREPIAIASLSDALNIALIPGKFPPPRPTRSVSPDASSIASAVEAREGLVTSPSSVSFSQSQLELRHSGDLPAIAPRPAGVLAETPPIDDAGASALAAEAAAKHRQRTAQVLEHLLDLANSWEMARGHLSRNWFRTYLATKSSGRYKPFVDWLCGPDNARALVGDPARRDRGVFRHYDKDHSGTIEIDELQHAVEE